MCPVSGDEQASDAIRAAHDPTKLIGRVVGGKYQVERILGRGGMGTIYVAVQQPLGRRVALKVLHPSLGEDGDPEFQKRFLLEAATLSQLAHPNIVVVHDYGSLEDQPGACFMVMELLEGRTINQVLNDVGTFDTARALRITRDIARALRAAHDLGVIHRDLKPANVMLSPGPDGETVKVLDFGLVKVVRDDSEELTQEGRFLGSPRYMSPEQIQRLPMDGRSDLYSLGVILYRMLSGQVPFAGEHAVQTLMAHLSKPVPPMSQHGVSVPHAVEQIVMTLLEKEPTDRHRDAAALIRAIDGVWPMLSAEPLVVSGEHARLSLEEPEEPQRVTIIEQVAPLDVSGEATARVAPVKRRPAWLVPSGIALLFAIFVGAGAGIASIIAEPDAETELPAGGGEPPVVVTSVDDPPAPPEPPPPPDPVEAAPSTFRLTVRSVPPGATLERDGIAIGETPLTIELDRGALASEPAGFVLRMSGRTPVTFQQGPSEADVEIERVLARRRTSRPDTREDAVGRGGNQAIKTSR